jgi:hypothetical protein
MPHSAPSALITDEGRRVLLRVQGHFYELSQDELRALLGLPPGPPGLGITIDGRRLCFEFGVDGQCVEMSAGQLHRRLTKQLTNKE